MLSLTRKCEYALIAASHLARAGDMVVSARDIAARYSIPLPLLMNVLKTLNRCGLVESVRGARGGYMLARPARDITLQELIEGVEGPVRLVRCVTPASGEPACDLSGNCPIRDPLHRLHERFRAFLTAVTVADVAFDGAAATAAAPLQLKRALAQ